MNSYTNVQLVLFQVPKDNRKKPRAYYKFILVIPNRETEYRLKTCNSRASLRRATVWMFGLTMSDEQIADIGGWDVATIRWDREEMGVPKYGNPDYNRSLVVHMEQLKLGQANAA